MFIINNITKQKIWSFINNNKVHFRQKHQRTCTDASLSIKRENFVIYEQTLFVSRENSITVYVHFAVVPRLNCNLEGLMMVFIAPLGI